MIATSTIISSTDLINLLQGISSQNLGYLGLCVTIILAAGGLTGGFYYLFNFKPLTESIRKQEEELARIKTEVELRIEQMKQQTTELRTSLDQTALQIEKIKNEAFKKLQETEQQFKDFVADSKKEFHSLKEAYGELVLDLLWDEHYMWEGRGVHINSLRTLIEYLEKKIELNGIGASNELWAKRMLKILSEIKSFRNESASTDGSELQNRLLGLLDKIELPDAKKEDVKKEAKRVFA